MHWLYGKRIYAIMLTLALTLVVTVSSYITIAQHFATPNLTISSDQGSATCSINNLEVPKTTHNQPFSIQAGGFRDNEVLNINITFPDGRQFDLQSASTLGGPVATTNLNLPSVLRTDLGGELHINYTPDQTWSTGCYQVAAQGLSSGQTATTFLVIETEPIGAPIGGASLAVTNEANGASIGLPDAILRMSGDGFGAGEPITIMMIAPNGATATLSEAPLSSPSGGFEQRFKLAAQQPAGVYTFTATGQSSGYRASAQFELQARIVVPVGDANLTLIVSVDPQNPAIRRIEFQGQRFDANEGIILSLHQPPPSSAMLRLLHLQTNEHGQFATPLTLDQSMPTGLYQAVAEGTDSGKIAVAFFDVFPADAAGPIAPSTAPPSLIATTAVSPTAITVLTNAATVVTTPISTTIPPFSPAVAPPPATHTPVILPTFPPATDTTTSTSLPAPTTSPTVTSPPPTSTITTIILTPLEDLPDVLSDSGVETSPPTPPANNDPPPSTEGDPPNTVF